MGWDVVERYVDDGISGATSLNERPQGKRLLATTANVVIFWSMDRFTRSASRGLRDIEALEAGGTSLVFVKEAIDTSTPSGRLFRTLLAAFAEFERETIRDRNMSGRYGAAEKGRWATGRVPFGYRLDPDGDIVIDEAEAEVVRKVFALRREGRSIPDIAAFLNKKTSMAPRTRKDRRTGTAIPSRFSAGSVAFYLRNPAYRGDPIERSIAAAKGAAPQVFYFPVPAIVSAVDWEAAQAPLVGRRPVEGAGEKRRLYALSGRLFHGHQDRETPSTMYGHTRALNDTRVRYYRCSDSRSRPHKDPAFCPGLGRTPNGKDATSIDASWVEGAVLLWTLDNLGTPAQVVRFLENTERRLTPAISISEAEEELARVQARRERWLGLYTDGLIEKAEVDVQLRAIAVEVAALERILDGHTVAIEARERVALTLGQLLALEVEDTDDQDPHADETPPRGSAEWRHKMRAEAISAYRRIAPLSEWAVEETRYLAEALDLSVVLSTGEDYLHPTLALEVGNEVIDQHLGGRTLGPWSTTTPLRFTI